MNLSLGVRFIKFEDRTETPYTEAVLLEIHRLGCVVPGAVTHRVLKEVRLGPYTIPADTYVAPLHPAFFMDAQKFPDPEIFNPDRYISANACLRRVYTTRFYISLSF